MFKLVLQLKRKLPSKLMIGTILEHTTMISMLPLVSFGTPAWQVILDYLNDKTFLPDSSPLSRGKKAPPNCLCAFIIMFQLFQWNMRLSRQNFSTYVWQSSTWWVSMVLWVVGYTSSGKKKPLPASLSLGSEKTVSEIEWIIPPRLNSQSRFRVNSLRSNQEHLWQISEILDMFIA